MELYTQILNLQAYAKSVAITEKMPIDHAYHPSLTNKIHTDLNSMIETQELSIVGLDETFPESLYVLHHPSTDRYGCFCHEGVHGLASFTTEPAAFRFAEWIDLSGMVTREVSFDEARELAKARPMPVVSLMLLDRLNDPQIHFVR